MSQFDGSKVKGGGQPIVRLLVRAQETFWSNVFLVTAFVVAAALLTFGLAMTKRNNDVFLASERERIERSLFEATNHIRLSFFEADLVASKIESLLTASGELPKQVVAEDVDALIMNNPNVIAVALAPDLVVTDTFPLLANQRTVGLRYQEIHRQMPGIARAYRQGRPIIAGPVPLVQGGIGYILRHPVFLSQPGLATEKFWGVISIVIKAEGLINNHSAAFNDGEALVFTLRETFQRAMSDDFGSARQWSGDEQPVVVNFSMAGAMWQAAAAPLGGWPTTSPQGNFILMTSLLMAIGTVSVFLILHRVSRSHQRNHALLLESIACMNEGFVAFDEDGRLVLANQRFKDYYPKIADLVVSGATFDELINAGVRRLQFPEAVGQEEEWIAKRIALFHNPKDAFIEQNCNEHWVKVTEAKTPYGYTVGIRTDVTAEKRAMDAAETAAREKTEFISNVSHELRTPLTVIVGRASFLQHQEMLPVARRLDMVMASTDRTSDEVKTAVSAYKAYVADQGEKVVEASKHMSRLVEDLLDWTTVERGNLHIQKEIVPLRELTDAVAYELRPLAQARGLDFQYVNDAHVDVMADRARLRQIMYNLLSNAIKFTDHGHVRMAVVADEHMVMIRISDTGCGIPEKDLDRVFERFQQVDSSDTRRKGGFGLGLSIAKQLAVLHDGELTVSSRLGLGSCFELTLPQYNEDAVAIS